LRVDLTGIGRLDDDSYAKTNNGGQSSLIPAANACHAADTIGTVLGQERATSSRIRIDPLRRFTPTPHFVNLTVMGRSLRIETNELSIAEHAASLFSIYQTVNEGTPEFVWRIVSQMNPPTQPPWPQRFAFSDEGLRFVEFGQSNFLAVDLDTRQAIGFLAKGLADDELGFTSPFLDNLFCMTAASLGLTAMSIACVGLGEKGVLVVGPPNNGKTTASYVAAKQGLEFFSDRAMFMEIVSGKLVAWGDFWPAAFRPETLHFHPELQLSARLFRYKNFNFYYLDKRSFQALPAHPIVPVCCVFLDRQPTPILRLSPVPRAEFSRRLGGLAAFQDDIRFEQQRKAVFSALETLPAYDLVYNNDPAIAAKFFPNLLRQHLAG
jgi:hypothetical protein